MSAPVNYTCPDIDAILRSLEELLNASKEWGEDVQLDVESYLRNIPYELEKLRDSNSTLRDWGETLERELDTNRNELGKLMDEYSNLKDKMERMEEILIGYGIDY